MIEEAMKAGDAMPAVAAPPNPSSSGGPPAVSAEPEELKKSVPKKKIDSKKQALLAKRKKYDPRAAIKKAKESVKVEVVDVEEEKEELKEQPFPVSARSSRKP